jgi:nucleotide-binding universal stress UspA family protein
VPVLLARGPLAGPPSRILVGVDESAHARAALAWARLLADRSGASLTAVHVFRPVYLGVARVVSGMDAARTLEEKQRQQTEHWYRQRLEAAGCTPEDTTLRFDAGDAASALVAAQRGGSYDLTIVGSRGAGGVSRMLLGSVATAVLRGATCPVLVVSGEPQVPAAAGRGIPK